MDRHVGGLGNNENPPVHVGDDGSTENGPDPQSARLYKAIENGDFKQVDKILTSEHLLEVQMEHKFKDLYDAKSTHITPLGLSVVLNQTAIVELLLWRGASVQSAIEPTSSTALHLACRYGIAASVSLLISVGAEINRPDGQGYTALRIAILYDRAEMVSRLLDANATMQDDEYQSTTFQTAAMNGKLEVAKLLLKRGPRSQVEDVNKLGNAALHLACLNGHHDLGKWLLDLGVPIEITGGEKCTPLHFACIGGSTTVAQMLLKAGADVHRTNIYENNPLMLACFNAHPDLIGVLQRFGALVSAVDKNRNSCFHQVVNSPKKYSEGHRKLLRELKGLGLDIDQPNIFGFTPLFIACRDRKTEHVSELLELGADVNAIAPMGASALMEAACKEDHAEIIEKLLGRHADVTIANKHGLTALGLACRFGRLQHARILLQHASKVTHQDLAGHTPLFAAAENTHVEVAFEMVKTTDYYPVHPLHTKAFKESADDGQRAGQVFLDHFQRVINNAPDGIQPLIYWAIANGQSELLTKCLRHEPEAIHLKRGGATWLHIAAQHGQSPAIVERLSEAGVFEKAGGGTTALHLAASNGALSTTQTLLNLVTKDCSAEGKQARVAAIIEVNQRDESALSLAISERHKDVENFFWSEIKEFGTACPTYANSFPAEASEILEVVAEWERPALELVLEHLLRQWFPTPSDEVTTKWTALHWAVYHSQAIPVWWLLSKGGYSLGTAIQSSKAQVQRSRVGKLIQELLQRPPPILDHVGNPDNDFPPQLPELQDPNNQSLNLKGIVVDVLSDGKRIRTPYADPQILAMIYNKGPHSLMKDAKNLDERHLDVLKERLRRIERDSISTPAIVQPPVEHVPRLSWLALPVQENQQQVKPFLGDTRADLQLRWINLPVNELQLLRDLVTRLSHESGRSQMDHRTLMTFLNRSWGELAAGGGRNYMKPQCTRLKMTHHGDQINISTRPPEGKGNGGCTALYVPFLTLGEHDPIKARQESAKYEAIARRKGSKKVSNGPENLNNSRDIWQDAFERMAMDEHYLSALLGPGNGDDGLDESINSRNVRPIVHEPMTLDQYYYPTILDTKDRDNDQVISKYINKQNRSDHPDQSPLDEDDSVKTILMVDQLWIWIIDDKTIVTSMTERSDQPLSSRLLHRVLDAIINGESQGRFERPNSVKSVMELILGVATGFFMQKFVPTGPDTMKGPMEIFRESIRDVADKEINLFNQFLNVLDEETRKRESRTHEQQSTLAREAPKNPHHIIADETRFLDEIRDIRDELHMLRSLAEDQEYVWKQAFGTTQLRSRLQYNHPCTPTDVKSDLDEMIREADTVQESINTLLDLRQKQASLVEAESGRLQANDTARQSNSVFVFTVITIVFLPLSFLSSLFALDITDFPHDSGGDIKYEGWWLFPILFGVSAIVSIPAIFLAWNVNTVQGWFQKRHQGDSNRRSKNTVTKGLPKAHNDHVDSIRMSVEEQRDNRTRARAQRAVQDVPRRIWGRHDGVYRSDV